MNQSFWMVNKMKDGISVLEVINSLDCGGAESLLKNFVLQAKNNEGFNIDVCVLYSPPGIFQEELENVNIPIWNLGLNFKYDLSGIIKLITLIKKRKYNIVHVHLFPSNLFNAITSLFLPRDIKWIFSEHSIYNRRRSFKIFKILDSLIYSRYFKIICVSKQVQCALVKWLPCLKDKAIVIPNAVPLPDLSNYHLVKVYDILFIGRLVKAKGIDILLRAINILKNKYKKKLKVAIVGEGSSRKELEDLSVELEIDEEVKFLGVRKDIEELMVSSKIFVLPSRWEGLPMVILEAMRMKMGIIATKVGGIPEVIEDGKEGILISSGDVDLLVKAINKLLDNKVFRKTLGFNAYKKVKEKYSIETYTKKILNLYKSMIVFN